MTIRFLSVAGAELASAAQYYEQQVPSLGADFLGEVEVAIGKIRDFPEAWSKRCTGVPLNDTVNSDGIV